MRWLAGASPAARRVAGRFLYPRGALVHRMNLELPPADAERDVVTLLDVVAWRFDDESPPVRAAAVEARRAAAVICISEFTAQEAVDFLGISDPIVVYCGVNPRFLDAAPLSDEALGRLGVRRPFVLTAGGASRRKNLEGLATAWQLVKRSRPDLALVLSGPEHPRRTALFGGEPQVRMVGRVDDSLVPGLMASAEAVVMPSLYEGFGLPALEAMAANVPVVAANTTSLPEVVGDAGLLVDPAPAGLAEGILAAVSGDASVAQLVRRGRARVTEFTWQRCAEGHARVWSSLI